MILWSGGADSTLVLRDELEKHGHAKTLAIDHFYCDSEEKKDEERGARRRILEILREQGFKIDHTEVSIRMTGSWFPTNTDGLPQPAIWLSQMLPFIPADIESVKIGYIRGDDFWHYRQVFVNAFQLLKAMLYFKADLDFPLEWTTKSEVLQRLRKYQLDREIWSCYSPVNGGIPCQTCAACQSHRVAEFLNSSQS